MSRTTPLYNVPRGAAYLTSQQALLFITYFVFYILLARILSPTEVGEVGILALVQALFIGFTSGSFPSAATRFISRSLAVDDVHGASGVARITLRLSIAIALPGLVFAVVIYPFVSKSILGASGGANLLVATFVGAFLLDLMNLYTAFFIGIGRYAQTLYQNVLYVPLSRGLGLVLALQLNVLGVVLGWAIGGLVTIILSMYMWHGRLPEKGTYHLRPILTFSIPVFASALVTIGQQWGDVGIIYALLGAAILGPYYITLQSVSFLSTLWTPINQAIYPALAASHSTGETEGVSQRLDLAVRLINLAVLPIAAAIAAVSPTVLEIVYGPKYTSQSLSLSILALSSIFVAQGGLLVITLQAVGKTREYLRITLVSTILYLVVVGFGVYGSRMVWGVNPIEALAGAFGRAILAISIVILARHSLPSMMRPDMQTAMSKAVPLAIGVALPLLALDQYFLIFDPVRPLFQLLVLLAIFLVSYILISRQLRVFHRADFAILHDALPRILRPYLRMIQRIVISDTR